MLLGDESVSQDAGLIDLRHELPDFQIHRGLAVSVPLLRVWVHCPRASNGLLPRRSNLVGYVRWDAQSDRFPPCQTIIPTAFRSQSGLPTRTEPLARQTLRVIDNGVEDRHFDFAKTQRVFTVVRDRKIEVEQWPAIANLDQRSGGK